MKTVQYILIDKQLQEEPYRLLSAVVNKYYVWFMNRALWNEKEKILFNEWFNEEQGKVVLYGKSGQIRSFIESYKNEDCSHAKDEEPIFISLPNEKENLHLKFKKFQLFNKRLDNIEKLINPSISPHIRFYINKDLGMSFGKMIAQIGHVCTNMFVKGDLPSYSSLVSAFEFCSQQEMEHYVLLGYEHIRDNGHTEIPPNSLTVAGKWV